MTCRSQKTQFAWWHLCIFLALALVSNKATAQQASGAPEILYPFVAHGKWGYINASGDWVIKPRFDRAPDVFDKGRALVANHDLWGYIDRAGNWLVKPQFTNVWQFDDENSSFEIVSIGNKKGILSRSNTLTLPVRYDDITLCDDRAFARDGNKLGIFMLDGHWLKKPEIPWSEGRDLPAFAPEHRTVMWYEQGDKWGIITQDGRILFSPKFDAFEANKDETDDRSYPVGLDFKYGRAWVLNGDVFWLITDEGKILARHQFRNVREWTDGMYVFNDREKGREGLVSATGKIIPGMLFDEIDELRDGVALVKNYQLNSAQNGGGSWPIFGFIDSEGKTIAPLGKYVDAQPFSEGLAAVCTMGTGYGYIDPTGREVIPPKYSAAESFSGGLAKIRILLPGKPTSEFESYRTGFIDRTGHEVIPAAYWGADSPANGLVSVKFVTPEKTPATYYDFSSGYVDVTTGQPVIQPQFGSTTLFCRGYAWVTKIGEQPDRPVRALIDRNGKVLTDYTFYPPEKCGARDSGASLDECRWRGDLVVITRGDFHNGLAAKDGTVLIDPVYNRIGQFHDGVAVALDSRQMPKWSTLLIDPGGKIISNGEYRPS